MGLLLIGCSNTAYWLSWIITGLVFSTLIATLMHGFGILFGFSVFLNTPYYVMFLVMFSVSLLDLSIAFLLLTVIHNQSTAYTLSYTFILISMITTMALMDSAVTYKLFFNIDMPEWSVYVLYIFEMMPSFHFSKLYSDVTRVTSNHLSFEGMLWVLGREWEYDDLFKTTKG
jgi:ABC-2 family transporter protein